MICPYYNWGPILLLRSVTNLDAASDWYITSPTRRGHPKPRDLIKSNFYWTGDLSRYSNIFLCPKWGHNLASICLRCRTGGLCLIHDNKSTQKYRLIVLHIILNTKFSTNMRCIELFEIPITTDGSWTYEENNFIIYEPFRLQRKDIYCV